MIDGNVESQNVLIKGLDGEDYNGETHEYDGDVLARLSLLCSSIQDQCDQGKNGLPCLHDSTPSGQRNRTCDESVLCGTQADDPLRKPVDTACSDAAGCMSDICTAGKCVACSAHQTCEYASCSCVCKAGYFGEY